MDPYWRGLAAVGLFGVLLHLLGDRRSTLVLLVLFVLAAPVLFFVALDAWPPTEGDLVEISGRVTTYWEEPDQPRVVFRLDAYAKDLWYYSTRPNSEDVLLALRVGAPLRVWVHERAWRDSNARAVWRLDKGVQTVVAYPEVAWEARKLALLCVLFTCLCAAGITYCIVNLRRKGKRSRAS